MNNSYHNSLVHIDLTESKARVLDLPEQLREEYLGGKGFAARLMYDLLPAGTPALDPANPLLFLTGPLTGTRAPSMRGCIATKSPLTGIFLDSYFGGEFSQEIKFAGYDGIIITGKADEPVYITLNDQEVEIVLAQDLWGKDALETNRELKTRLKDTGVKIAGIGPAGENLVPFALVSCEYNRQAGRGGAGAVMGSKNLKALAVRGNRLVRVHDPTGFREAVSRAESELDASEEIEVLRRTGTASAVEFANEAGLFPVNNFQGGWFEKAEQLGDKGQSRHLWLRNIACQGCPIHCSKVGVIRRGKYAGVVSDTVEYESAGLLGANLGISDIRAVTHLASLCDRLGLDSMSAGGAIGFAMEACEQGLIPSPPGIELQFGNVKAAEYLIRGMALQENELGILLSGGVRRAAKKIGHKSEEFALHTKGLETPAWGPRGVLGTGLAFMTADRGGCHQRGLPAPIEAVYGHYLGEKIDPHTTAGKAAMVVHMQNYSAGTDALVKCDFATAGISDSTYARMLTAATGIKRGPEFLHHLGAKIWNLIRTFNLREGLDPAEDRLPQRFLRDPVPDGPQKGQVYRPDDIFEMLQDYYGLRGWDEKGRPKPDTLQVMGIGEEPLLSLKDPKGNK
ncbi:MAG: aldehyde ferredoxin oxidoreductase family protein [Desulfonatronovibrionaceae bacterium]